MDSHSRVSNSQHHPAGTGVTSSNAATEKARPVLKTETLPGGIIHFDATETRRHRMRSEAMKTTPQTPTSVVPSTQQSATSSSYPHTAGQNTIASGQVTPSRSAASSGDATEPWWDRVMRDFDDANAPAACATPSAPPVTSEHSSMGSATDSASRTAPRAPEQEISQLVAAVPSTNGHHLPSTLQNREECAGDVSPLSETELKRFLINFVVEQTGYPEEIVEMDADLEADLGIDSIKKAQMFGEIGEHFGLQPDENVSLDDFLTLSSVLAYLVEARVSTDGANEQPALNTPSVDESPLLATEDPAPESYPIPAVSNGVPSVSASDDASPSRGELQSFLVNFVVEQTGYPEEIVEMDADLEADLGIDSIKKAQMFGEIGEYFSLPPDENMSLDDFPTLDDVLAYLQANL
ncbi:acyl carrier protein [Allorhodopirellula heiligendammensis]|uniref:Acyl carrier protein n=1 Tax=Allorhodopirellula heiligendammensis TaxID=2714739 RepID=A0A5C6C3E4_9BACT|nr:acyl carrier protein [Allorhodopirellula heiligendammensis]